MEVLLNIFSAGVVDVLSMHKILPILINDRAILMETLRILASNMGLLLGSIAAFNYVIKPGLSLFNQELSDVTWLSVLYHSLWVVPIYVLLYTSSLAWYATLAEATFKHLNGKPKTASIKSTVEQNVYAMLVWAVIYVQVQFFLAVVPGITRSVALFMQTRFTPDVDISSGLNNLSGQGNSSNTLLLYLILVLPSKIISKLSYVVGCTGASFLYGWYGFEYYWTLKGIPVNDRFAILESHWLYFVGFGTPITILMQLSSFFVGFGAYLAVFPFIIIVCAVTDYESSYKLLTLSDKDWKVQLPVFSSSKSTSMMLLKRFDKYIRTEKNK